MCEKTCKTQQKQAQARITSFNEQTRKTNQKQAQVHNTSERMKAFLMNVDMALTVFHFSQHYV